MTKIEEVLEKYKSKTDHYADQEWYDENVEKAMIEYANYKCLEAIRNTRYKAIEIVNEHQDSQFDIDRILNFIARDIQNIDNKDVIPKHD